MLSRSINQLDATALVVGIIIGASIFVQPSVITGAVPTVSGVFGVWFASGILTLFGALIAAELASAYPHAGGVYVFLKESFSPAVGVSVGLGDVLDDAHRNHRRHRDSLRALRHVLFSHRRRRCASHRRRGRRGAHRGQLPRREAGKRRADDVHHSQGRGHRSDHRGRVRARPARSGRPPARPRQRGRRRSHSRAFPRRSSPASSRSAAGTW